MVLAGTEAAASEAVEEASAEETVEDSEGAIKWEEGESLVQHRLSMATRGAIGPVCNLLKDNTFL